MRGCVAGVLVIFALSAFSQCTYSASFSGAFRASYLDLSIDGNDLWVATSYGVQLFDRSVDPPALVASLAVPGITRVVRAAGGGIAYAGSGSRVYTISRSGSSLTIPGSIDAGATVNDILVTPLDLYVGTSNGMGQYDLLNRITPQRTPNVFLTTGANITSLALTGSTLYVDDGDSSVEIFSILTPSVPQKLGTLDSLPRPLAVKATASRVYVSDGITTDVFIGRTKAFNAPFGPT